MIRQQVWTLIGLSGAIVAVLLLASGLAEVTFRPGHMYDLGGLPLAAGAPTLPPDATFRPPDWLSVVVALLVLASLVYLVVGLILWPDFRREVLARAIGMLIVMLLFYLAVNALQRNRLGREDIPSETSIPIAAQPRGDPFPTFAANPAPWLIVAISAPLAYRFDACHPAWYSHAARSDTYGGATMTCFTDNMLELTSAAARRVVSALVECAF